MEDTYEYYDYYEGYNYKISRLNQFRLERVGTLPFEFYAGACTNMDGRKLFLCFDYYHQKRCYWSEDPLFDSFQYRSFTLASYRHAATKISSSECKFSNFHTVQYKK